jgi:hypothetical protein
MPAIWLVHAERERARWRRHLPGAFALDRVVIRTQISGSPWCFLGRYGHSIRTLTRRSAANSKIRRPDYPPTLRGISVVE